MSLYLTVYAPDDPNGASLGTVTAATELEYRHVLHGPGNGRVKIARGHAQAALLTQGRYCRVNSDIGVVGAFWLENATVDLSSNDEQGGEFIEWTGRGALAYLDNAIWDHQSWIPGALDRHGNPAVPRDDGRWYWFNDQYGDILKRGIDEAQAAARPSQPIPDLTYDWGSSSDSDSVTWPTFTGSYSIDSGQSLLTTAQNFTAFGFFLQMSDDLLLSAYNAYGTARTSTTYAAGKVRFLIGSDIAAALQRKIAEKAAKRRLVVGGRNASFVSVTDAAYTTDPQPEAFLSQGDSDDPDVLTQAGTQNLAARRRRADVFSFPTHDHGDNELVGIYEPGPPGLAGAHYWVGDTVTLHTGTDTYDVSNSTQTVMGITWTQREAGDYDTIVELGSGYYWNDVANMWDAAPGMGGGDCTCMAFCPPGSGTATQISWDWDDGLVEPLVAYPVLNQPAGDTGSPTHVQPSGGQVAGYHHTGSSGDNIPANYMGWPVTPGQTYVVSGYVRDRNDNPNTIHFKIGWYSGDYVGGYTHLSDTDYTVAVTGASWVAFTNNYVAPALATGARIEGVISKIDSFTVSGITGGDDPLEGTDQCPAHRDHSHLVEDLSTAATDPTLVLSPDGGGGVEFRAESTGAPTGADYLVGTAQAGLSAEIVVGTTPGGELGGTWASPTVDATHSGSAHHPQYRVRKNSTGSDFTRGRLNLIEGSNVTLTVADDGANDEVDVTIAATSGSSLIVQEDDSTVDAAATTLDFTTALNVTSSPAGEANIAVDLGTGSTQAAAGNHTHSGGGSTGVTGLANLILVKGVVLTQSTNYIGLADEARAFPIDIPAPMRLRGLAVATQTGGSATHEWGLFDCSTDATSCTKVAGGSGVLNSGTDAWRVISATSAPVSVNAGSYVLVFKWPNGTTRATIYFTTAIGTGLHLSKRYTSYTWDDTPNMTTTWTNEITAFHMALYGDMDASNNQW